MVCLNYSVEGKGEVKVKDAFGNFGSLLDVFLNFISIDFLKLTVKFRLKKVTLFKSIVFCI